MPFFTTVHVCYDKIVMTNLMNLDIDRAINRYAFCGNGSANLHNKFSETDHLKNNFNVFFDPQNMGVGLYRHPYCAFTCDIDQTKTIFFL